VGSRFKDRELGAIKADERGGAEAGAAGGVGCFDVGNFCEIAASTLVISAKSQSHEMIVTANRTCVLLASEDMITQRIDAHLARAKRATVSVCKHLRDGRSETPAEKSLPNVRRETSLRLTLGKVRQKTKRVPGEVHLPSLRRRHVRL